MAPRRRSIRKLAHERTTGGKDVFGQPGVCGWVDDIHAGAHDGDGDPTPEERPAMGGGVDAEGEAADHDHTGSREVRPELLGNGLAVWRGQTGADDGHAGAFGRRPAAAGPERRKWRDFHRRCLHSRVCDW